MGVGNWLVAIVDSSQAATPDFRVAACRPVLTIRQFRERKWRRNPFRELDNLFAWRVLEPGKRVKQTLSSTGFIRVEDLNQARPG